MLLQSLFPTGQTPLYINIIGIIILFGLGIVFVIFYIRYKKSSNGLPTSKPGNQPEKYNKYLLRKTGFQIGLEEYHIDMMDKMIKQLKINHPMLLFTSRQAMDNFLRKGIALVQENKQLDQEAKAKLIHSIFEIKEKTELNYKQNLGLRSTHLIKPNQGLIIQTREGVKFRSKIISNQAAGLDCAAPVGVKAQKADLKWGRRLKVYFFRENDTGYSFVSHIVQIDSKKINSNFLIKHSNKLKREQKRKHTRKPIDIHCFFYPVQVIPEQKKSSRLIVNSRVRMHGIMEDISAKGCRLIVRKGNFSINQLFKLEFNIIRPHRIEAIARVVHIHPNNEEGTSISFVFRRIDHKAKNQIYSYIFNYI